MTDRDVRILQAWEHLNDAYEGLSREIERSLKQRTGMPMRWFELLSLLSQSDRGGVSQAGLADQLGLSQSATSRMVQKLLDEGYLTRERSEHDARESRVRLTAAGAAKLRKARAFHTSEVAKRFGDPVNRAGLDVFPALLAQFVAHRDLGEDGKVSLDDESLETPGNLMPFGESMLSVRSDITVLADTQHVRECLEPLVLVEAARFHTEADLAACRSLLAAMQSNLNDPSAYYRADWALHARLAQICQNRVLRSMYLALLDVLVNSVSEVVEQASDAGYVAERFNVHVELLAAVESRDEARVHAAAERHRFMRTGTGYGIGSAP